MTALDPLRRDLAHLHRRLGFGATAAELDTAVAAGWEATAQRLLDPTGTDPGAVATPAPSMSVVDLGEKATPERKTATATLRDQHAQLQQWWLARMVAARDPWPEKRTLLWHGHFATSIQKVRQSAWMLSQNQIERRLGAGSFHDLTLAIGQDPAMLIWLDAGRDTAASPNENFARELMELFTLGVGSYTEDDVRAGARCFTGWSYDKTSGAFRERPRAHDSGTKTFLGRTGSLDGTDAVSIVTSSPASARFVTGRLWNRLVAPVGADDPDVVRLTPSAPVALAPLFERIVADPAFRAAQGMLVAQPIEYVVGALRQLGLRADTVPLTPVLSGLGQVPFAPPNVGGWPAGSGWLTTAAAMARLDFARAAAAKADLSLVADVPAAQRIPAISRLLSLPGGFSARSAAAMTQAADPTAMVALALCSPEYVVR